MDISKPDKPPGPLILSDIKCIYCGKSSESLNYNCSCHPRPVWQNYYRSANVKFFYSDTGKEYIRNSVHHFSFDSVLGMRQYAALPMRGKKHPSTLLTGLSPMLRLSNLSFRYGADLYVKDESYNPAHTTTDREMLMCALNSLRTGRDKAVFYGTSAAAVSAASVAASMDISIIAILDDKVARTHLDRIRALGADVISVADDNGLSGAFQLCAQLNADAVFADSGYDNWSVVNPFRLQGQKTTAVEIVRQLATGTGKTTDCPDFVVLPAVLGTSITGIWKGFQELYELGLITKLPRLVPVGVKGASPICKAVKTQQMNAPVRCDLRMISEENRKLNSDYLLAEAFDSIEATRSVIESGGIAIEIGSTELRRLSQWLLADEHDLMREQMSLHDESSLLALAALEELKQKTNLQPWHKVVSVIPGNPFHHFDLDESFRGGAEDYESSDEDLDSDVLSAPVHVSRGKLLDISSRSEELKSAFRHLRI